MIIYVSGGARSGKSSYAQQMALQLSKNPVYVATARIWDEDFARRVQLHRHERGPEWDLMEQEQDIHLLPLHNRVVVIDCVTLWLTNLFMEHEQDMEEAINAFRIEIDAIAAMSGTFIIISNEIGMGLHADTEVGRKFTDLQGWANQYVAAKAEKAIFMVSGLPLFLK
ncbi:bifunctional adenosylcobinamide kinase/adenosylcobinamide-phosphate guanylyltransferase [Dyadobacter crusticola]|uniref:bifunctional adenosylcobinamide kinase/adenosylcobinamide-phosphate guanylyltransferase n=1 Tax=Dyadobacter crusticola TaxID=292407 RepID=UPI0004E26AF4|nr:bifunctional adenosylcobinamide kinase/adenosylcobinamide-phosphate guanylyltransferase [Dyadobacter crusticola]